MKLETGFGEIMASVAKIRRKIQRRRRRRLFSGQRFGLTLFPLKLDPSLWTNSRTGKMRGIYSWQFLRELFPPGPKFTDKDLPDLSSKASVAAEPGYLRL